MPASLYAPRSPDPVAVGFVVHVMQVAGAEVLVAETIRRLGPRVRPLVICLDAVGPLGETLEREGVPVVALGRRPGVDLRVAWRLARVAREHALEVVHAHQYTPFFYAALAKKLARRSFHLMFTEHGRHYPDVVGYKRRVANRLVFDRLADEVNAVCRFSAEALARLDGFRAGRIEVMPNGIDFPEYQDVNRNELRQRLGLPDNRRFVTCVARFHPVKDHATLLRAFHRVAATLHDVDLLLAGDGQLRTELMSLTDALGIASRVRFLGVRGDVPDLLRASDVFALLSVSEGASLTLLEAMASAIPSVVTDVGGNPELVHNDVEGVLVPRGDAEAAAAAMLRLLTDDDLSRRLGTAARERVRLHFQLNDTIDAYGARYERAAARRRRAGASAS